MAGYKRGLPRLGRRGSAFGWKKSPSNLLRASRAGDDIRFTKSKGDAYTITDRELERAARKHGFEKIGYKPGFVRDLATIESGTAVRLSRQEVAQQLTKMALETIFVPSDDGSYLLENSRGKTQDLQAKRADWVDHRLPGYMDLGESLPDTPQVSDGEIKTIRYPTPLDKAFYYLRKQMDRKVEEYKFLQTERGLDLKKNLSEFGMRKNTEDDDETNLKIHFVPYDPAIAGLRGIDQGDAYLDFLMLEGVRNREGGFRKFPETLIKSILEVTATLRDNAKVTPHPKTPLVEDPKGKVVKTRPAKGLDDLERVSPSDMTVGADLLAYRMIQSQVQVRETYSRDPELPIIMVLIDRSGSMRHSAKNHKALGILWYLVKQVINEKAIIIFSFFETDADHFHVLDFRQMSRDELISWFHSAMNNRFNGGTTHIGQAAARCIDYFDKILERPEFTEINIAKPSIVLINDGEDDATNLQLETLLDRDCTLHGFILLNENDHIRYLANATGGHYVSKL